MISGFGDITLHPKAAVYYFLLIMIGLAVATMAFNTIQMQIEKIFTKIVNSINSDFKNSLLGLLKILQLFQNLFVNNFHLCHF